MKWGWHTSRPRHDILKEQSEPKRPDCWQQENLFTKQKLKDAFLKSYFVY